MALGVTEQCCFRVVVCQACHVLEADLAYCAGQGLRCVGGTSLVRWLGSLYGSLLGAMG